LGYDLFITPAKFDADAIRSHFEARPHYQVSETQAVYSNEDTGALFSFDFEEDGENPHVAFNLNFGRPHVFAFEAEPEVAAFVSRFDCRVEDPQADGSGDGRYSRESFLEGWTTGNRFAFLAIRTLDDGEKAAADPTHIEAAWAWNYGRSALQQKVGANIFVPKIVWLQPQPRAQPVASITWTFGVPTLVPESLITHIVLVRQERSLKKLFLRPAEPKFEFKLLSVESGVRLRGVERSNLDGRPVLITPATGPLEVQALFSGSWSEPQFRLLAPDQVFGADLVALAKNA
jgi:hypothetical protein